MFSRTWSTLCVHDDFAECYRPGRGWQPLPGRWHCWEWHGGSFAGFWDRRFHSPYRLKTYHLNPHHPKPPPGLPLLRCIPSPGGLGVRTTKIMTAGRMIGVGTRGLVFQNLFQGELVARDGGFEERVQRIDSAMMQAWQALREKAKPQSWMSRLPTPPSIADWTVDRYLRIDLDGGQFKVQSPRDSSRANVPVSTSV